LWAIGDDRHFFQGFSSTGPIDQCQAADNFSHVTILVDSPSQIQSLTLDSHEQFVQVPGVPPSALPAPERPVLDTKLPTPLSDGFKADCEAALRQKIFHIPKAQAKSVVKANSMADNFMGKSISAVTGHTGFIWSVCSDLLNLTIPMARIN
jgi:hypothetical protein